MHSEDGRGGVNGELTYPDECALPCGWSQCQWKARLGLDQEAKRGRTVAMYHVCQYLGRFCMEGAIVAARRRLYFRELV